MANSSSTEFVVLFVCRANQIRSVIGEHLLTQALQQSGDGVRAAHTPMSWQVRSAGVDAAPGRRAHPQVTEILGLWDIDTSAFRSRALTAEEVERADLILTAERAHRSAVVALDPLAVHRTFTVRQFGRLVDEDHPIELTVDGGLELCEHARSRRHLVAVADPSEDDIADPVGGPDRAFRHATEQIATSLSAFGVSAGPLLAVPRRSRWRFLR